MCKLMYDSEQRESLLGPPWYASESLRNEPGTVAELPSLKLMVKPGRVAVQGNVQVPGCESNGDAPWTFFQ